MPGRDAYLDGLLACEMAVLVEANSVIVRMQAIRDRYAGGWSEFADAVPNNTLCSDDEIARVGFMNPNDCDSYIGSLERSGLTFLRDGQSEDIAVAVQTDGITVPCEWLEFVRIEVAPGQLVAGVRLKKGTAPGKFIARRTGAMRSRSVGNLPSCRPTTWTSR